MWERGVFSNIICSSEFTSGCRRRSTVDGDQPESLESLLWLYYVVLYFKFNMRRKAGYKRARP